MADEKLIFPIGFDLEEGVVQVEKDWNRVQRRLQKTIDGKPLTIKVDSKGIEQFETYSENMRNSINKIREAMKELDNTWNNMSDFEKFDENGDLTSGAQELVQKYNELTIALQTYGKTLGQIASDAKHAAEEEIKALERKEQAQIKANRASYDAQVKAGQQSRIEQEKNRADYEKLVADYAKREQAEARLTQRGLQYEHERIRLKQQAQQASDIEYENLVRQIKAEQQLAANQANSARQASYNAARKQGMERVRILNAEEKSIDAINRKLQIQQERLRSADMGSAKFQKIAAEIKRLTEELDKANARVAQLTGRATQGANQHTRAVQATNQAYATQSTYLSRLAQRMIAYASVAQAMSFLRNIKDVTAEFELQRVALGALIQDAQKANMIFEQIKVEAVESPYEVKDLVTYTKQLAAYGVEADDLMGTMNQLADISAGLGTDMNRIILAYGQIQAAGVLKGTELRQLTELGLPMVELLADYYSTLRNEVVTMSEVSDMISNKEIPFEAVQDILEDLTSEGGRFFDMQSKQAETLAGQWSNMKDTLSIMFDEMGRSEEVQTLMRGLIDATKSLAENWRVIWQTVKGVGLTYAVLKSASAITRLLGTTTMTAEIAEKKYATAVERANIAMENNGRVATLMAKRSKLVAKLQLNAANATNILSRSFYKLGAIIMANPVGAIMTLVSVLGFFITKNKMAKATAETFAEEQSRLASDMAVNIESSIKSFRRLANEVVKFENGSANQQAALRKLKDQFGDMLPEYQLTAEYLSDISREANNSADAFNKLETAIRGQQTAELQLKLIEREQERIQEMYNEVYDMASGGGFQFVDVFGEMTRKVEDGEWFESVYNDWRDTFNDIYGDVNDLAKLFAANSETYGYMMDYFYKKGTESYNWEDLRNLYNQGYLTWEQYKSFVKALIGAEQYANISAVYDLLEAMGMYQENVDKIINDTENLDPAFSNVTKVVSRAQESFKKLEEIGGDSAKHIREAYDEQMLEIQKQALKGLYDEIVSPDTATAIEGYFNTLGTSIDTANVSLEDFLANVENDKLGDIELPNNFIYGLNELRKMFGYMDDEWRNYMAKQVGFVGNRTVTAFNTQQINSFSSLYDALDQTSKAYEDNMKALQKYRSLRANTNDKEAIDIYEKEIAVLEERTRQQKASLTKFGWTGTDDALKKRQSLLKDELSIVEKIYKEYQSLRKYMSVSDAQATINQMFGNVPFKILGMATSFEEMREQLNKALKEAKRLGDTKLVMDIEYSIGKLDADEVKKNMEREIKSLSDDLSRTKTAKEFFDRMLGLTGDKQLSATLTMSVYGVTQDSDLGSELGETIAKQMQEQVQKYFGNIDISSAINKATGDIDPIELEKLLTEENMSAIGEDNVKEIRNIITNLISADAKFWDEMMDDLEKTQSYGDRLVKVYETIQKRITAIRSREDLDDTTKDNLAEQVKAHGEKEMRKLQYEAFKDSPLYIAMFEKLDATSTSMLTNMRAHLEGLKGEWKNSLDPAQLKELQKRINDIDEQLSSRNPFKGMINGFKEFSKLSETRSRESDEDKAIEATRKRLEAEEAYQRAVNEGKPSEEIKRLAQELDNCVEAENDATANMLEWDNATRKVMQSMQALNAYTQLIQATATTVNDIAEAFGGWGDSADEEFWNTMLEGVNKFVDGVAQAGVGVGQIMAGDIIGGVTSLVSGIGGIVSAIGNLAYAGRIRKAEKEIERLQSSLDALSYAYDRLQKAQEKAFGNDYISNYLRQLENLEAQQEAYLKQAEAERSKGKKADEEKIKEYENQARDAADAIKDMYGSLSEKFLGSDLTSAARDFASAWIEAYKEFSNTTDAMKAKFQDMIQNMVVESLLARVMERALEPVFTMIDEMGEGDFYSPSFWKDVMAAMQTATENGVVGAENVMSMLEQMGVNLRGLGGEMTGISRDIATASEESILGLAAGINTQNFYISQVPAKLDTIIGLLRGDGAIPQGSGITLQDVMIAQNQFLSHLPTIAQHTAETVAECRAIVAETRRTADALDRVIKPDGTRATYKMNVVTTYQG